MNETEELPKSKPKIVPCVVKVPLILPPPGFQLPPSTAVQQQTPKISQTATKRKQKPSKSTTTTTPKPKIRAITPNSILPSNSVAISCLPHLESPSSTDPSSSSTDPSSSSTLSSSSSENQRVPHKNNEGLPKLLQIQRPQPTQQQQQQQQPLEYQQQPLEYQQQSQIPKNKPIGKTEFADLILKDFNKIPHAIGEAIVSNPFVISKHNWCLSVYPGGINQENIGIVLIFLRNLGESIIVEFQYSLFNEIQAEVNPFWTSDMITQKFAMFGQTGASLGYLLPKHSFIIQNTQTTNILKIRISIRVIEVINENTSTNDILPMNSSNQKQKQKQTTIPFQQQTNSCISPLQLRSIQPKNTPNPQNTSFVSPIQLTNSISTNQQTKQKQQQQQQQIVSSSLVHDLKLLFTSGIDSDIILKCSNTKEGEGGEVKSHKLILSIRCPGFKTILEASSDKNIITIEEQTSLMILKHFLIFVYTGSLSTTNDGNSITSFSQWEQLLRLSDKFELFELFKIAETNMISLLNSSNAIDALTISIKYPKAINLKSAAVRFLIESGCDVPSNLTQKPKLPNPAIDYE